LHLHTTDIVTVQDSEKRSALHAAAFCGEAEIAELLLLNGARVNTKDSRWLTPLHRACCSKSVVSTLRTWYNVDNGFHSYIADVCYVCSLK